MARSFVRQGVNIICSNMTVSTPRKLGLNPAKAPIETAGITIYSKIPEPLLNILDKKLDDCFECKMPLKVWGGLTTFFAGIAIAALVVVVVVSAPISGPIVAAIAGGYVLSTAIAVGTVATAGAIASASYAIYKKNNECDEQLPDAKWEQFHKTVFIEGKNALLDSSFMNCPVGGRLEIIIDDVLASKSAQIISNANNMENYIHWSSKFINGALAFFTGGVVGVSIASGLEIYNTVTDDGKSEDWGWTDVGGDIGDAVKDNVINTTVDTGAKHLATGDAGLKVIDGIILAEGKGILTAIDSDKIFDNLYYYGQHFSWKNLGKNFKNGLLGAVIGFGIDEFAKYLEKPYQERAKKTETSLNEEDEKSFKISPGSIGIISKTQDK